MKLFESLITNLDSKFKKFVNLDETWYLGAVKSPIANVKLKIVINDLNNYQVLSFIKTESIFDFSPLYFIRDLEFRNFEFRLIIDRVISDLKKLRVPSFS